jgi:diadenosine tetraphosphatase ApaH/serine/threonine PP2A family protein phosphatase
MTHDYGFFDECYKKFGSAEIYQNFVELFDFFPLSAVVGGKLFCLHGGLSKDTFNLDDIRQINRFMEIPQDGKVLTGRHHVRLGLVGSRIRPWFQ